MLTKGWNDLQGMADAARSRADDRQRRLRGAFIGARHVIPAALLLIVGVALAVWLVHAGVRALDTASLRSERHHAASAIGRVGRELATLAKDYAFWDDVRRHVVDRLDLDWAANNVGTYVHDTFHVDATFVLGSGDAPLYAAVGGMAVAPEAVRDLGGGLRSLIAHARATQHDNPEGVSGLLRFQGQPAMAAAAAITPEYDAPADGPPRPVLIYVRLLDTDFAQQIGREALLDDLRIVPAATPVSSNGATLPLLATDGSPLGTLVWHPVRPGQGFLWQVVLPVALALLLMTGLAVAIYRQALRHARALGEAMVDCALSEQRALAASQAKSDFLANLSHEVRTPLNAILGFSQVMQRQTFGPIGSERYLEYLASIHSSADALLAQLNEILDFARLDGGRVVLQVEPLKIADLASTCVDAMGEMAADRGIVLKLAPVDPAAELVADRQAVHQMLVNLISNAVKFTPPGGEAIVSVHQENDGWRFEVRDTGLGIPADRMEKIKEPFVSGPADARYLPRHGTGLGLAITNRLASMHGGRLEIESEVDKGTRARIWLPAAPPLSPSHAPHRPQRT